MSTFLFREVVVKFPGWTVAFLTLGILFLLRWWSDFHGLYGQDSYAYVTYGSQYWAWWEGSNAPKPFFWPEGYPALGELINRVTQDVISGYQLLSAASLALVAGAMTTLACRFLPVTWSMFLGFLTIAVSPYLIRSGLACMSDALGVALVALSMLAATRYREEEKGKWLFLLVILVPLAILVRYPVALLCGGILLFALPQALRKKHYLHLAAGLACAVAIAWFHFRRPDAGLPSHHFLETWSPGNWFRREFVMQDGSFQYALPNLVYAFAPFAHPGYLGVLGLTLPIALLRWPKLSLSTRQYLILAVVYMLFIAGIPFQNSRFLIPVLPLLFLLLVQHERLWKLPIFKRPVLALGVTVVVLAGNMMLVQRANQSQWASSQFDRQLAAVVFEEDPQAKLFTFGKTGAMRYYGGDAAEVHDLWDEAITAEAWKQEHTPTAGNLVLFNETAFSTQWAGKSPMVNWQQLKDQFDWVKITNFEGGWTLHALQ